jgi:hypothetical protein
MADEGSSLTAGFFWQATNNTTMVRVPKNVKNFM